MAILETEVFVNMNGGKTINHYKNLGYKIPKTKNGKVILGEKILVKVDDLPDGSHILVTKICDMENCNKIIHNQIFQQIIKCRNKGDGKDRCFDCSRSYAGEQAKSKIKYENSLECYAKENDMEYLLLEFSPKNNKHTNEISRGTHDEYLWECSNGHEYKMTPKLRTQKDRRNCPYCSNQKILRGYNDMWTTRPEVAKLLKNKERGYEISSGSKKKEVFICPNCNHEDLKQVKMVTYRGLSCGRCGDGYSYPEKIMFNVLYQSNLYFETQKTFEWSKNINHHNNKISGNKSYDFYIPSLNMIIETHGEQHYKESYTAVNGRTLQEEQINDEIKMNLALENGISHYVVIDCSESKLDYIKNNLINNYTLVSLIDLNIINWNLCNEYATNSLVKLACEHWNNGIKSSIEIGKLMKIHCSTVARYLKQGTELDWCDYDPKQARKYNKKKRAIVQITLNNEFVRKWESAAEASRILSLNSSCILQACKGSIET